MEPCSGTSCARGRLVVLWARPSRQVHGVLSPSLSPGFPPLFRTSALSTCLLSGAIRVRPTHRTVHRPSYTSGNRTCTERAVPPFRSTASIRLPAHFRQPVACSLHVNSPSLGTLYAQAHSMWPLARGLLHSGRSLWLPPRCRHTGWSCPWLNRFPNCRCCVLLHSPVWTLPLSCGC